MAPPRSAPLVSMEERDGDRAVVWLRGEHDASTLPAISEAIARAIADDDADLVIDLSQVDFMDAATVGIILRARELLRSRSRALELRSPSRRAERVLRLCGVAGLVGEHRGGP